MAQDWTNLIGGLATGFGTAKNQARDRQMMEDYKKAQIDLIKQQSKHQEATVNLETMKFNMMAPILQQAMGGQPPMANQPAGVPNTPIPPQYRPAPGPVSQAPQQSVPDQMAGIITNPLNPTGGQAPPVGVGSGLVSMDPSGQTSYRNNNVFNVKYASTQDKFGGSPDTNDTKGRNFTTYPSKEAGVAAATDLIQRKYAPMTITQGIETFAPTWQNPNTPQRIKEIGNYFGVDPNTTKIGDLPLAPFMGIMAKYESPSQINPAIWGGAGNLPINQTVGKMPWDQGGNLAVTQVANKPSLNLGQQPQNVAMPQPMSAQTNPQQFQPVRTIDQADALGAAWKYFTGSELKDKKYDYRVNKSGDIMVMREGQFVGKIDGGPNASWHQDANGNFALLDTKTGGPIGAVMMPPEMVKVEGKTATGAPYTGYIPKPKYPGATMPGQGLGAPQQQFQQGGINNQDTLPQGVTGVITGPGERGMAKKMPDAVDQYISKDLDPVLATMDYLKSFSLQNKDVFGLKNQLKFDISKGKYTGPIQAGTFGAPSADVIDFWNTMKDIENLKVHAFGGSNLTAQELSRALMALPNATTPEVFATAVDAVKKAAIRHKDAINKYYSLTDEERTAQSTQNLPEGYKIPSNLTPQSTSGMRAPQQGQPAQAGGLPPGAIFKGTSGGRKVYQLPDGRGYME
jgi:hypothetical protein